MIKKKSKISSFSNDVINNKGYIYTTNAKLSSYLANQRLTNIALEMIDFRSQKVLDIGCGDGTYTIEIFKKGKPASIHGIDIAKEAIDAAKKRFLDNSISFEVQSAENPNFSKDSFDIVHMRGILHHINDPAKALAHALKIAPKIIVLEPNGYNPILKIIEKTSKYHIEHDEKSYRPKILKTWTEEAGGIIKDEKFVGLVPFFCPSFISRILKFIEPIVEKFYLLNMLSCAVYAYTVERKS